MSVRLNPNNIGAQSILLLYKDNTQYSSSGAAGITSLLTWTLPGGTMGPNDSLRITVYYTATNNANAKNAVISFGTTSVDILYNNCASAVCYQGMCIVHNNNSTSAQKAFQQYHSSGVPFGESTNAVVAASIDTTADTDIMFRAEGMTASDNLNLESVMIELLRAP